MSDRRRSALDSEPVFIRNPHPRGRRFGQQSQFTPPVEDIPWGTVIPVSDGKRIIAGRPLEYQRRINLFGPSRVSGLPWSKIKIALSLGFPLTVDSGARHVRRIWVNGQKKYDIDAPTPRKRYELGDDWRFYGGSQIEPDQWLKNFHGADDAIAYQGQMIAIFRSFWLRPYANDEVPLFSFEVWDEDYEPTEQVLITDQITAIVERTTRYDASSLEFVGFTAADTVSGLLLLDDASCRDLLDMYASCFGFDYFESGGKLKFVKRDDFTPDIEVDTGDMMQGGEEGAFRLIRAPSSESLAEVKISYYDRSIQETLSTQQARMEQEPARASMSRRSETMEVPLIVEASDAMTFAARRLHRLDAGRVGAPFALLPSHLAAEPTDLIQINDGADPFLFKVTSLTINSDDSIDGQGIQVPTDEAWTLESSPGELLSSEPIVPATVRSVTLSVAEPEGGQTVTAIVNVTGTAPITVTYQWFDAGVEIPGATGSSYIAVEGQYLSVTVTANNAAYADEEDAELISSKSTEGVLVGAATGFYVTPDLVASGSVVYAPTLLGDLVIAPALVTSGSVVYAPAVAGVGTPQSITPDLVASGSSVYAPTLIPDQVLAPDLVASGSTVYSPTLDAPAPTYTMPSFRAQGGGAGGTGDVTAVLPTLVDGDGLVMFISTANQAPNIPAGWTQFAQIGLGTAGAAGGTMMTVAGRRATASETAPTLTDPGDYQSVVIASFQNIVQSGDFWEAVATATLTPGSTSVSFPSTTTLGANRLVVNAASSDRDGTSSLTWSAFANAALTSVTERIDVGSAQGSGGSIGMATGGKATAGSTGSTTATQAAADVAALLTFALKPKVT